jgi:single-stranded DNA-binding protein
MSNAIHVNECLFIGKVCPSNQNPEGFSFKYTAGGLAIFKMNIKCETQYTDKNSDVKTKTCYVDTVAFGRDAENYKSMVNANSTVKVMCEYRKRSFDGEGGKKMIFHEFHINELEVEGGVSSKPAEPQQRQQAPSPKVQAPPPQKAPAPAPRQAAPPPKAAPAPARQNPPPPPPMEDEGSDNEDIPF